MTETTRRAILAGSSLALAAATAHAAPSPKGEGAAAAVLRKLRADLSIPAVSGAAARPGRLIWSAADGMADLELARPADPQSRFRLGSCSKTVTAVATMRLVERGLVALDAPIGSYRPSLPAAHRATTLRQLLGHQGGLRHYLPKDFSPATPGGPIDLRNYRATDDALAIFIDDPLVAPRGEANSYSTFGFTLAGAVLESATGLTFPQIVAQEVSGPLGLMFVAEVPANITPDRVRPYQLAKRYLAANPTIEGQVINAPPVNPAYKWAGGGLLGRAADLAQMGAALIRPGYLKQPSLDELFRPQTPAKDPGPVTVGLAWRIDRDKQGRRRFHHGGSIEGGRSGVVIYPDAGLCVALTSNLGETPVDPLVPLAAISEAFGV